jgi:hypothetical protein
LPGSSNVEKLSGGGSKSSDFLSVTWLLVCVDVPDYIVWKPVNTIAGALGHLCKALSFGLVLESVARKVDSCINVSMSQMRYRNVCCANLIGGRRL